MIAIILGLICSLLLLFYLFLISPFDFWKKRGVNGPKPLPFVGNFLSSFSQKRHLAYDIQDIYEQVILFKFCVVNFCKNLLLCRAYKHSDNYVGIYASRAPQLLITNAAMMRRVLVTDFKHFHDNDISTMVSIVTSLLRKLRITCTQDGTVGHTWTRDRNICSAIHQPRLLNKLSNGNNIFSAEKKNSEISYVHPPLG